MNTLKPIILCCTLLLCITSTAQILAPAKWQCHISKQDVKLGGIVELVFSIELNDTWHLYGNLQNYEIGPLRTSFEFERNDTYVLIGNVVPIGTKHKYDEVFEVDVNYFEHTAEFRQKVKILSSSPMIKGYYEYQVCTTVDGKCILGDDDFEFNIKTID